MHSKPVFGKLVKYFLQGVLYITPVALTIYAIWWLFSLIDDLLLDHISNLVGYRIPGMGLLIIIILLTIFGFLGTSILFNPFARYLDSLIGRAPLVKIIYSSLKDFMSAFVGKDKKFTEPVLVKVSKDAEMERLGFVTNKDLSTLGIENGKVAVYFPFSYALNGSLFIVPAANVKPISASPTDVMKFVVSAGVTHVPEKPGKELPEFQ
jgi:uncharacterized membrane protein